MIISYKRWSREYLLFLFNSID